VMCGSDCSPSRSARSWRAIGYQSNFAIAEVVVDELQRSLKCGLSVSEVPNMQKYAATVIAAVFLGSILQLPRNARADSSSPAPALPAFASVTLGETVQQLLVEHGDPLQVSDRQGLEGYMYITPSGNALIHVILDHGYVVAVRALNIPPYSTGAVRPSAFGIQLGDTAQVVADLRQSHAIGASDDIAHGVGPFRSDDGLDYYFDVGLVVTAIEAHLTPDRRAGLKANSAVPSPHNGSSFDDAVVIKANSEHVGVQAEYEFLSYRLCSRFMGAKIGQAIITHNGKPYDKLSASNCSQASANGDYYFDISDFYGKI
jgi:hypothetical protein